MLSEILLENQQIIDQQASQLHEKDDLLHEKDDLLHKKDDQILVLRKRLARELLLQGHNPEFIASETQLPFSVVEGLKQP